MKLLKVLILLLKGKVRYVLKLFLHFGEGDFGMFSTEGDLQGLRFRFEGYLLISYSHFLQISRNRASHHFT